MCASDVVAGKAGASTAMESVFHGGNRQYSRNGRLTTIGTSLNSPESTRSAGIARRRPSFMNTVKKLADRTLLDEYKKNLVHLAMEPGTDDVARFLLDLLGINYQQLHRS